MTTLLDETDTLAFHEIVVADCFNREPSSTSEWLRSPEIIDKFVTELRVLAVDLQSQLASYKEDVEDGTRQTDPDWRKRARRLKSAVDKTLIDATARQRELRTEHNRPSGDGKERRAIWAELRRIRRAIHLHQERTLADDWEPTDHDYDLWAELDHDQ